LRVCQAGKKKKGKIINMAIQQNFGQHYIHYSNGDNSKKKTFIFVKLTDSALNAIEDHISSKVFIN